MKKIALTCVVLLVACGGSGSTDIDGGGDDTGTGGDVNTSPDTGSNDGGTTSDVANDTSATDSSTFNVQSVSGLVLWLEGDLTSSFTMLTPDGGTAGVGAWADQTSHHNDAHGSSNVPARNPSVKSSAINGLSAVHFNKQPVQNINAGQMVTIANNSDNSLNWGTGDFYISIVGDFDNNPSDGASLGVGNFYSKASQGNVTSTGTAFYGNLPGNGQPQAGLLFATAFTAGDFITTSTGYNNSKSHLFAMRRQNGKLDLFVDGTSVATTTPGAAVDEDSTSVVRIGADGDANLVRLDGDIGEIIAVKGALLPSDQQGIETYLKAKWATP